MDEQVEILDTTEIGKEIKNRPWPIREQPQGMQMRFKPYGFDTGAPVTSAPVPAAQKEKSKKDKKRSQEDGSEKKSHKKKKSSS